MPRVFRSEHGGQHKRRAATAVTEPESAAVGVLPTASGTCMSTSAIPLRAAATAYGAGRSVAVRHQWLKDYCGQAAGNAQLICRCRRGRCPSALGLCR